MKSISFLFLAAFGALTVSAFAVPTVRNALVKKSPEINGLAAPSCPMKGAKGKHTKKGGKRVVEAVQYVGRFHFALNENFFLTLQQDWTPSTFYEYGEIVLFHGVFWSAKISHTSSVANQPRVGDYWTVCA
jgi:hypothetical protein